MKLLKGSLLAALIMMILCYVAVTFLPLNESNHEPVIKCASDQLLLSCSYQKEDLLRGVTAFDAEDGNITEDVLVGDFSRFKKPGLCKVKYVVFDSEGNHAEYERNVYFYDYEPPKITLTEPLVFTENSNSAFTLRNYLEATDSLDGEVTKHIKVESTNVDYAHAGTYTAKVTFRNSFRDAVKLNLPIHILENKGKGLGISLKNPLIYIRQNEWIEPKNYIAKIWRDEDKQELSMDDCEFEIASGIDYTRSGVYQIYYKVYAFERTLYGETWLTVVVGKYGG